jgi:hypothetical protein
MLVCCVLAVGAMLVTLAAGCEPKKGASQAPKIIKERIVSAKTEPPKAVKAAMPKGPVSELVLPTGATRAAVTQKDFVMDWLVLGPFEFRETDFGGGHQQSSADHLFMPNEANLDGSQEAPKGTSWRPVHFQGDANPGQVNLDELYNAVEHAAAYAVAWLDCPNEIKDAKLYVGSDDYLKVWVNGKLVHTYKTERRASAADQDIVPGVTLKKGLNRVVVKCVDVVLAWDFYLRLTDAKDRPIAVKVKG